MKTKTLISLFILSTFLIAFSTQNVLKPVADGLNTGFMEMERPINTSKENLSKFFGTYQAHLGSLPTYGRAATTPWSGSYWPIRYLGIAARYGKNNKNTIGTYKASINDFVNKIDWCTAKNRYFQPSEHNAYYETTDFQDYVNDYYSPAEKYDLLVGDTNYTLTNYFKNYGSKYGCSVAGWMGNCHGWSPASIYEKRPTSSVTVRAADGKTLITFLPDDIKGLVSQLYANYNSYKTIFLGNRCGSALCFSINPATFVIAAGNQIGLLKKVMIFDQQSNAMIWNFPAYEYSMEFFNPNKRSGFTKDYRSVKQPRGTGYVVGVRFVITYTMENNATHSNVTKKDQTGSNTYQFTLELDDDDSITGGEWLYNERPEYVWKIDFSNGMYGSQDKFVSFNGSIQSLNNVTPFAKKASSKGEVLRSVVEWLIGMS